MCSGAALTRLPENEVAGGAHARAGPCTTAGNAACLLCGGCAGKRACPPHLNGALQLCMVKAIARRGPQARQSLKEDNVKHNWQKRKLTVAVSAALANASAVYAAGEIEEVIVTATKRAVSMQDIAVAVQASSGDGLRNQGIETFDEYVETLPNVVGAGNGPGQKELYIRGSATEQASVTVAPAQGSAPGVALYVDEQPVSFGGRNLDVYGVDLERIEVLSGPQGTLFGASSQSGNLRLITNKPRHGEFEGGFNARYGMTRDGSDSASVDGYVNVPLGDALAARVVVYSDNQGGWVDNVPGTFTPSGIVVDRNNVAGYGPPLRPRTPEQRAMQMTGSDSIATARAKRAI